MSKLFFSLSAVSVAVNANVMPNEVRQAKKKVAVDVFGRAESMMRNFDLLPNNSHSSLLKSAFKAAVDNHEEMDSCKDALVTKKGTERSGEKWEIDATEVYENCAGNIGDFLKNDLVRECNERHAATEEKLKKVSNDEEDEEGVSTNVYKAFSAVVYNLWEFPKEEEGFLASLPVFGTAFSSRKRPSRGALVAKKVDKYLKEPDVVVFTEAWNNINALVSRMKMHGYKHYIAPGTKSNYVTAQLSSGVLLFSKHKIVDFDHLYFEKSAGTCSNADKGAVYARLKVQYNTLQEVIEGARDFYYVNIVATQLNSGSENEDVRDEQVKQLNRFIGKQESKYCTDDNVDEFEYEQLQNKHELFLIAGSHGASAEQVSHWSAMLHFDEHKLSQYGSTYSKNNEMALWSVNNDANQIKESQSDFIVNRLSNNGHSHPTVDLDFSQVLMPRNMNSINRKDKNVWFKDFSDHYAVKQTVIFKPSPVEEVEEQHDARFFAEERKNSRKLVQFNASQREAKVPCFGLCFCLSGAGKKKEGGCTGGSGEGCTGGNEEGCTGNSGGCTGGDEEGCTGNKGGCTGGDEEGCTGNGGGCTGGNEEGCTGGNEGCTGGNEGCTGGNKEGCTGGSEEGCTGSKSEGCTGGQEEGCTGGNGGQCVADESCCGVCGCANGILNTFCPCLAFITGGSGKGCVGGAFEDPLMSAPLGVARNAVMESGIAGLEVGCIESFFSSTFSLVAIFAVLIFILIAAYVGMKHANRSENGKAEWGDADFTGNLEAAIGARPMAKNI